MKGFILAAGFGTRLRPVTLTMPKPMVPLCNRPLIGWAVESFLKAGVRNLIVNLHHLPEQLEDYLTTTYGREATFYFSREDEILGTGGGIRRVRPELEHEEFCLANGDTVQFPRWGDLRDALRKADALAALTLRHPPPNDRFTPVFLHRGLITGFGAGRGESLMFAGSHVISPRIFGYLPEQDVSGIVEHAYVPALARMQRIAAIVDDGLWFDIGTPRRYIDASRELLAATVGGRLAPVTGSEIQDDSLVHESSRARTTRSVVGQNSVVQGNVRDSVIWDRCRIAPEVTLDRCVVAHDVELTSGEFRDVLIVRDEEAIPAEYERREGVVVTAI